jgi:hypothetical protein
VIYGELALEEVMDLSSGILQNERMNESNYVSLLSFLRPDDFRMEEVKARYYSIQYPEMLSLFAERSTTNTFDWKNVLHVPVGLNMPDT